jgi:glutamate carboxypeptidase
MEFDIRASTLATQDAIESKVRSRVAEPWGDGVESELALTREHPPMERTPAIQRLVSLAREVAAEIGFELRDAATGGASDANTIAGLGVPVLDGLGPIGGDDHSDKEWIDVETVPQRVALLAGLISRAAC